MAGRPQRFQREFDPRPHERELVAILSEIAERPEADAKALDRIVKRHPRDGRGLFSRSQIIAGYRRFAERRDFGIDETQLLERLRLRPVRTLSGITPVTVLTAPYPCPGECVFCPSDARMPKSYLADEPGAQRAEDNGFDPYLQTWNRLAAYRATGHPVEKVELIVLGGTWSAYPEAYQVWFTTRCLEALNDFGAGVDRRGAAVGSRLDVRALPPPLDGRDPDSSYNDTVRSYWPNRRTLLAADAAADWAALVRAQRDNESAGCRCVGLVFETRPDRVSPGEVERLRRLGATKVQLGVQSLSDRVLALSRRGHDVARTRQAIQRLRGAGFKIHAHWMPNLPGATPEADLADFARLFDDEGVRPDELKIYPCALIESAELVRDYERGTWAPYDDDELMRLLAACLEATPRYCRVTRVIRDFSAHDIAAGTHVANLRELAERSVSETGGVCRDIRAREIRGQAFRREDLGLRETGYATSIGREIFLETVTPDDRIVAFARLSLPTRAAELPELRGRALLREVRVYGGSVGVGRRSPDKPQHRGLGAQLIEASLERAREAGYGELAVISAVGTRGYYRGLGFADGVLYQHRHTDP